MEIGRWQIERRTLPAWAKLGEGILAGLAGTAAMTAAQTRVLPRLPIPEGKPPRHRPNWPDEPEAKGEPATETTARRLVEGLARRPLGERQKRLAGNLVHFAFGASWGAILGTLRPRPTMAEGLLFGTAVWMVSDNGLLPLLRIASWPNRYALGAHARALLAHLVYGAATAVALRLANERLVRAE